MGKHTISLTEAQETGLTYMAAERGHDPADYLQMTVAAMVNDWRRRSTEADRAAVVAAIADDPLKLARVKATLGID